MTDDKQYAMLVAVNWPDSDDDKCPKCGAHLKPAVPINGPDNAIAVVCLACDFQAVRDNCDRCGEPFTRDEESEHQHGQFFHLRCVQ